MENIENKTLAEDRKLGVVVVRADVEVVYRYLRDFGEATAVQIAEACFPLTFGHLDPLYRRLFRKSMAKTLLSISWLRGQKVAITCLSKPGFRSTFVLGHVAQDPLTAIGYVARDRVVVTADRVLVSDEVTPPGDQVTGFGDLMDVWHAQDS